MRRHACDSRGSTVNAAITWQVTDRVIGQEWGVEINISRSGGPRPGQPELGGALRELGHHLGHQARSRGAGSARERAPWRAVYQAAYAAPTRPASLAT